MSAKKQTPLVEWARRILQGKIKACSLLCWDQSFNFLFVNREINCFTIESDFTLVKDCIVTSLSVAQLAELCPWLARQQLPCIIPSFFPNYIFHSHRASYYPNFKNLNDLHLPSERNGVFISRQTLGALMWYPVFPWGLWLSGPWASLHLNLEWDHWVHVKENHLNSGCSSHAQYFSQLWRPEII